MIRLGITLITRLSATLTVLMLVFLGPDQSCHTRDNQSHPRPKLSPLHLVPLSSCPLQVAEITCASPLRNPYVILHHLASPLPDPEHHRPRLNEYSHTQATSLPILLAQARVCHTHLLEILAKSFVIVASLYLVSFHLCISLFSSQLIIIPFPLGILVFTFYVQSFDPWTHASPGTHLCHLQLALTVHGSPAVPDTLPRILFFVYNPQLLVVYTSVPISTMTPLVNLRLQKISSRFAHIGQVDSRNSSPSHSYFKQRDLQTLAPMTSSQQRCSCKPKHLKMSQSLTWLVSAFADSCDNDLEKLASCRPRPLKNCSA